MIRALYRGVCHTKILDFRAPLYPKITIKYTKYRFHFTIYWQRAIMLFILPTRCQKASLTDLLFLYNIASVMITDMQDAVCLFNVGSRRGGADTQGKPLLLFWFHNENNILRYLLCGSLYKIQILGIKIPPFPVIYKIQFLGVQGPMIGMMPKTRAVNSDSQV